MNILDCVEIWLRSLHRVFKSGGVEIQLDRTRDNRPKASLVFNLRRDIAEVDFVVWDSGEADLSELADGGSVKQTHFDDLLDQEKLAAALSQVAATMGVTIQLRQ